MPASPTAKRADEAGGKQHRRFAEEGKHARDRDPARPMARIERFVDGAVQRARAADTSMRQPDRREQRGSESRATVYARGANGAFSRDRT